VLKAFKLMLIAVIAVNVAVAIFFWVQGAFPVAGFLGLDVLALWTAFHLNYRAGQAAEYVRIAPGKVHVAAVDRNGVGDALGAQSGLGAGERAMGAAC
jgi:uncharacterized membrane protein